MCDDSYSLSALAFSATAKIATCKRRLCTVYFGWLTGTAKVVSHLSNSRFGGTGCSVPGAGREISMVGGLRPDHAMMRKGPSLAARDAAAPVYGYEYIHSLSVPPCRAMD